MNNVHVGWGPVGLTTILSNKQTKLRLNKSSVSLEKGGSFKIEVLSNYEGSLIWESSNPDVAVVDDEGNVTVVGYGIAKITVTSGELKGSCTITVKEPVINPPVEPDEPIVPEEPENKLDTTKMYYGYIPNDDGAIESYSAITEEMLINAFEQGWLKEKIYEASEFKMIVPPTALSIVLLPDQMYTAKKNILGNIFEFENNYGVFANKLKVEDFYLYGEWNLATEIELTIRIA